MKKITSILFAALLFGCVVSVAQITNPNARAPKQKRHKQEQTKNSNQKHQVESKNRSSNNATRSDTVGDITNAGYDVTFDCNVSYASLYIDGVYHGKANGVYSLAYGAHSISVEAEGYNSYNSDIFVTTIRNVVTIKLNKKSYSSMNGIKGSSSSGIDFSSMTADQIRTMGDNYADYEDFVNAALCYQKLVDMGVHKANDLFTLSNYYLGVAAYSGNSAAMVSDALNKSQKYIDEVDKLVPGNIQIVNHKAKIAKFREGDVNNGAALSAYNELLSILDQQSNKSDYARYYMYAYNYLATYYFNKGDKSTAKHYYQKWLEYDPNNESLRNYVNSLN